eukprot:sb/3466322/
MSIGSSHGDCERKEKRGERKREGEREKREAQSHSCRFGIAKLDYHSHKCKRRGQHTPKLKFELKFHVSCDNSAISWRNCFFLGFWSYLPPLYHISPPSIISLCLSVSLPLSPPYSERQTVSPEVDMKKISRSRVEACDREMEEMRQRFAELQSVQKNKPTFKTAVDRTKKVSISTKPRSNSDITPGSGGGGQTKKKRALKKSTTPAVVVPSPADNRRISHSYCEAVVYDPDTDETTVTSVNTGNMIKVKGPRARSVSMFEVVQELMPGLSGDEEGDGGVEEGSEIISNTQGADDGSDQDQEHTLTDAIQLMGANCPYKDLLLQPLMKPSTGFCSGGFIKGPQDT